jgi:PAS domain S-box-containing protein
MNDNGMSKAQLVQEVVDLRTQLAALKTACQQSQLRQSHAMLQAAFDNMQYAISVGHNGEHVMANKAAVKLFGYDSQEEFSNIPILKFIAPSERSTISEYARRRSAGLPAPTAYITKGVRKDGYEFDMEVTISTYEFSGTVYTLAAMFDITEDLKMRRAESEQRVLGESLAKSAEIVNQALDSQDLFEQILDFVGEVIPYDTAGVVLLEDDVMKVATSRNLRPEAITLSNEDYYRLKDDTAIATLIAAKLPMRVNIPRHDGNFYYKIPGFDGPHTRIGVPLLIQNEVVGFLLLIKNQLDFYTQQHIDWLTAFGNQITIAHRNHLLFDKQRQLTQELVRAQESERRRVAHDLHDDAGQSLTALRMRLNLLRDECPDESMKEKISEILRLTQKTAETIRNVSYGLRPPLIDTLGLNMALQGLCQEFARDTQLEVTYKGQEISELAEITKITLYRILQESLTNVARHAQATQIEVTFLEFADDIVLTINDNGQGFDVVRAVSQVGRKGLGILGMRERTELFEGDFDIKSQPGQGTHVLIVIPKA